MTQFLSSATGFITIVGAIVGAIYLYAKVKATDTQATIDAKDAAITTQGQVNDANDHRIAQLEATVARMEKEHNEAIIKLERENASLRGKVEVLEQYQAPEAIREFQSQQTVIIEILRAIQAEVSRKP
jgi:hypothetical protein